MYLCRARKGNRSQLKNGDGQFDWSLPFFTLHDTKNNQDINQLVHYL